MARNGTPLRAKTAARPKTRAKSVKITGADHMSKRKLALLQKAAKYVCPGKVEQWTGDGIPLVIGKREGYLMWDYDGHRLIDLHLNGGTFSLGHRNPDCIKALDRALKRYDIGNHHFPSIARTELAEMYARRRPATCNIRCMAAVAAKPAISPSRPRGMPPSESKLFRSSTATTATRGS